MKEIKMNAFIKTDIENAVILMKAAIMNTLHAIESGEVEEINLGNYVPFSLVVEVAESRGWKEDELTDFETNGWQNDCWYCMLTPDNKSVVIESCLWKGQSTKLIRNFDYE